ncbi:MAG: hypothetical protein BJ554DRAFT_7543, partial [Olpidium bornovanus]
MGPAGFLVVWGVRGGVVSTVLPLRSAGLRSVCGARPQTATPSDGDGARQCHHPPRGDKPNSPARRDREQCLASVSRRPNELSLDRAPSELLGGLFRGRRAELSLVKTLPWAKQNLYDDGKKFFSFSWPTWNVSAVVCTLESCRAH